MKMGKIVNAELIERAKDLRREGYSYSEISKTLGIPHTTCWRYIHQFFKQRWDGRLPVYNLSEAEKGYLAGIIDGEGTIGIYNNKSHQYIIKRVIIHVANTDERLVKYLKSLVPNFRIARRLREGKRKPVYYLRIEGQVNQYSFLKSIEPYLVLKRDKARQALDWLKKRLNIGIEDVPEKPQEMAEIEKEEKI
jgi:intein-encoded DNA endonuclease-like protein